jgi:hypothetical protein
VLEVCGGALLASVRRGGLKLFSEFFEKSA